MTLEESKEKFIQTWGTFGANWGINRTMAQIHAYLLTCQKPVSTDDIMTELQISRGNANMNLRELLDWGIIKKELIKGERKEFFVADKDVWTMFKHITKERRKREVEPVINFLETIAHIDEKNEDAVEFRKLLNDLTSVSTKINNIMDLAIKSDEHWLVGKITNLIK